MKLKTIICSLIVSSISLAIAEDDISNGEPEIKLFIDSQKIGPFGLYQNSDDKPKDKPASIRKRFNKPVPAPKRALSDILQQLKINGVNPSRREFIIGLKRFREGQVLPLTAKIKVKVIKVTSSSISFENIDNKESAILNIGKRNLLQRTNKNLDSLLSPNGESTPLLPE